MNYDEIINNIPKGLNDIEKARFIYIKLGKFFSYDEEYITGDMFVKQYLFDKGIKDIQGNKVVCTSLARIYNDLLNRVGVKSSVVIGEGNFLGHAWNELEIGGEKYTCSLIEDLMNIKKGFKTQYFARIDKDRIKDMKGAKEKSDKELKVIDDKIGYTYNRNIYE